MRVAEPMHGDVRLIAFADCRVMPWKNGGGVTREIFAFPPGAAAFDWRLSIADVAGDGPFSPFEGCARSIMLLEGNGMRLRITDAGSTIEHRIDVPFQPVDFDGGAATRCTLIDGAVRDFNIMSAHARVRHEHAVHDAFPVRTASGVQAIHCLAGRLAVTLDDGRGFAVHPGDTLLLLDSMSCVIGAPAESRALAVRFTPR